MRILLVTARTRYAAGWLAEALDGLDFGEQNHVTVLAVHPPKKPRAVDRFVVVDPSVIPYRPVVDAPVRGRPTPRSRAWLVVGALRAGRRGWQAVAGRPAPERASAHLSVACRTSRLPAELARQSDVVVAIDDAATLGAWHLAQRVQGPLFVNGTAAAREVVRRRLGVEASQPEPAEDAAQTPVEIIEQVPMPSIEPAEARLLIAPMNHARQAQRWATSVNEYVPAAAAQNFVVGEDPGLGDLVVDAHTFSADLRWRRYWRRQVVQSYTHLLAEAGRAVLGGSVAGLEDQYLQLQRAGLSVGRVAHGQEVTVPSIDLETNRWSPFRDMDPVVVRRLEAASQGLVRVFGRHDGPVYVSSLGLQAFLPQAQWLPLAVDTDLWSTDAPVLAGRVPVVAHAPGRFRTGDAYVEPLLRDLEKSGVIEYRRVGEVRPERRLDAFSTADVVVEQLATGDYGPQACEAMSLGRVVVGRVRDEIREQVAERTGETLPIVETTPETLESVLRDLVRDVDRATELAVTSRRFAGAVHSGALSANALRPWLHGGAA